MMNEKVERDFYHTPNKTWTVIIAEGIKRWNRLRERERELSFICIYQAVLAGVSGRRITHPTDGEFWHTAHEKC